MEPQLMNKATGNEGRRSGLFQLALVASISLCLSAFEYSYADTKLTVSAGTRIDDIELEPEPIIDVEIKKPVVEKPVEKEQKKPTNNSITPTPEVVISNNPNTNPDVILGDEETDSVIVIDGGGEKIVKEIYERVEDMPYLLGASHINDKLKREKYSEKLMYERFAEIIKYPSVARNSGMQGTVFVSFVVNTEGKVDEVKVPKSGYAALDEEAMRIVKALPEFVPGKQRGKVVNVRFVVPIKFVLN